MKTSPPWKHGGLCCVAGMLFCLRSVSAADYANFNQLPENEKDRIVWALFHRDEWGTADQKPVCEDLLRHQGYSFANATSWTSRATDLTEKQGWKEFRPLIQKIYDSPRNPWNYERAFRYLRTIDGRPVSEKVTEASRVIEAAGRHGNSVSDEALAEATATLLEEKDKEAVMVYALHVACWHAGKGGTMRGREAAASVLKSLPEKVVSQRVVQLHQASPSYVQPEIEWLMGYLKISPPNT